MRKWLELKMKNLIEEMTDEEIDKAIEEMKESAPGEDEVRVCYVRKSETDIIKRVRRMVKRMLEERAEGSMKA